LIRFAFGVFMPAPVVFLDKDGTLIENIPYNVDPKLIRLIAGAGAALKQLHAAGWRIAVVTNQSGVARGLFPESALVGVETRLRELLAEFDVPLAGFFCCPHHPESTIPEFAIHCDCRKPAPGMILNACKTFEVDPRECWVVGDSLCDVEAGRNAGCRTILVGPDPCLRSAICSVEPDFRLADIVACVEIIAGEYHP
jgi:D-glycero-D-manno-heptose 1,7-bisphosphate phosphatase